ncbi:MAG: LicD family protein [Rectinemataceae bacterium]|jgi:lipopolysaccharide cholinephosphotransferase
MTDLPDDRLKGENKLRQLQLILLRILKAFHAICEENGLRYWMDAGTLLGALRHGGFIPWDDDVDVIMPREDYLRFCGIAQEKLPFDMFFQSPESDPGFLCPWVKIRDRFSHLDEKTGPYPYSQAASIDVFSAVLGTKNNLRWRLFYIMLEPYDKEPERAWPQLKLTSRCKNFAIGSSQRAFRACMALRPLREAFMRHLDVGQRYWQYEPPIRWHNLWPEKMIFPLKKIRFEDSDFWGPADPHAYLTDYFGDYMTPPPPEKQRSEHGFDAIYPIGPNPHFSALRWDDYH